jgi:hypothetical protein
MRDREYEKKLSKEMWDRINKRFPDPEQTALKSMERPSVAELAKARLSGVKKPGSSDNAKAIAALKSKMGPEKPKFSVQSLKNRLTTSQLERDVEKEDAQDQDLDVKAIARDQIRRQPEPKPAADPALEHRVDEREAERDGAFSDHDPKAAKKKALIKKIESVINGHEDDEDEQ